MADGKLDGMQLTRRAALGLAVLTAAGCRSHATPTPPNPQDVPDGAALETARAGEQRLIAAYDHQIRRLPLHKRAPLQVERAIHATHLAALPAASRGGASRVAAVPRASVAVLLGDSARQLRRLSLAASDGTHAALLASIAASHTASGG